MIEKAVNEATDFIRARIPNRPEIALVLGSGLAPLADALEIEADVPTADIPHYPRSTVAGHAGRLLAGRLGGRSVVMLKGRVHAYEGYDLADVVLPIRVMARLGAHTLILTNAAGGIAPGFAAGDVMLIVDHLNLQGRSPLTGPNADAWGPRFPDMSAVYDPKLRDLALACAAEVGLPLQRGVYASCPGPQYETPAEVRMLRTLGADAVGMSTVPEAIAARHMGLRVLGFSVISNLAAGISPTPLDHAEVVEAGQRVGGALSAYLRALLPKLPTAS